MGGRGRQQDHQPEARAPLGRPVLYNVLTICLLLGAGYGLSFSTACSDRCLLNSDCAPGRICVEGGCLVQCVRHPDCPLEQFCFTGGCRPLRPGDPPVCRYDSGCDDAAIIDAAVPDASLDTGLDAGQDGRDARSGDGGRVGDGGGSRPRIGDGGEPIVGEAGVRDGFQLRDARLGDGELGDGMMGDGPPPPDFDLTGIYAVNSTLIVATGGEMSPGDVERRIGTLRWRNDNMYRLEMLGQEAEFLFNIDELDLSSPEGRMRYQFEYEIQYSTKECEVRELRFQRGRFTASTEGFRFLASEEREVFFSGKECDEEPYLARFSVIWSPVPEP